MISTPSCRKGQQRHTGATQPRHSAATRPLSRAYGVVLRLYCVVLRLYCVVLRLCGAVSRLIWACTTLRPETPQFLGAKPRRRPRRQRNRAKGQPESHISAQQTWTTAPRSRNTNLGSGPCDTPDGSFYGGHRTTPSPDHCESACHRIGIQSFCLRPLNSAPFACAFEPCASQSVQLRWENTRAAKKEDVDRGNATRFVDRWSITSTSMTAARFRFLNEHLPSALK